MEAENERFWMVLSALKNVDFEIFVKIRGFPNGKVDETNRFDGFFWKSLFGRKSGRKIGTHLGIKKETKNSEQEGSRQLAAKATNWRQPLDQKTRRQRVI